MASPPVPESFLSRIVFMATLTTSVVLLRWQILSAVLMFMASTLNIRFRKADYIGLAVISSGLGLVAACWFCGPAGHYDVRCPAVWHNVINIMTEMSEKSSPNGRW
jgi:uncharacterized membrane protein YGL010W